MIDDSEARHGSAAAHFRTISVGAATVRVSCMPSVAGVWRSLIAIVCSDEACDAAEVEDARAADRAVGADQRLE